MKESLGSVPVLYRRREVSFEDFSSYWRNVHGVFVASFPGPARYRMMHFAPYDLSTWGSSAVPKELSEPRQLGGIAEFVFNDDTSRDFWLNSVGTFADADDGVVFRRSSSYVVSKMGFCCIKSAPEVAEAEADETGNRIYAMFQSNGAAGSLWTWLNQDFAGVLRASRRVVHAQATSFDPYVTPTREYHGGEDVDRFLAPDEQHQVALEIGFSSDRDRREFFTDEFASIEAEFAVRVAQVHAYKVAGAYTLTRNGTVTLSGWLGTERAELVRRVKAENIMRNLETANAERRMRLAAITNHSSKVAR